MLQDYENGIEYADIPQRFSRKVGEDSHSLLAAHTISTSKVVLSNIILKGSVFREVWYRFVRNGSE